MRVHECTRVCQHVKHTKKPDYSLPKRGERPRPLGLGMDSRRPIGSSFVSSFSCYKKKRYLVHLTTQECFGGFRSKSLLRVKALAFCSSAYQLSLFSGLAGAKEGQAYLVFEQRLDMGASRKPEYQRTKEDLVEFRSADVLHARVRRLKIMSEVTLSTTPDFPGCVA
jgi:hypothetical protein